MPPTGAQLCTTLASAGGLACAWVLLRRQRQTRGNGSSSDASSGGMMGSGGGDEHEEEGDVPEARRRGRGGGAPVVLLCRTGQADGASRFLRPPPPTPQTQPPPPPRPTHPTPLSGICVPHQLCLHARPGAAVRHWPDLLPDQPAPLAGDGQPHLPQNQHGHAGHRGKAVGTAGRGAAIRCHRALWGLQWCAACKLPPPACPKRVVPALMPRCTQVVRLPSLRTRITAWAAEHGQPPPPPLDAPTEVW